MKRKKKRSSKANIKTHYYYALRAELTELMKTDPDAAGRRLDEIAMEDPGLACELGTKIGFFAPDPDDVSLGSGVYCTANCFSPRA